MTDEDRPTAEQHLFSSWSGGKDSCLALYRAVRAGGRPKALLTMLTEDGRRSRGHGLPVSVLERQASALGLELVTRPASWEGYEDAFRDALRELKGRGIGRGVFGDIDLEEHCEWVERVCGSEGVHAHLPLWKEDREALLEEFISVGFKAMIVSVRQGWLDRSYLGRALTRDLVEELEMKGVDVSGEAGEYHTMVTDGPLFSRPLSIIVAGCEFHDGYWFLDVRPSEDGGLRGRLPG